MKKTVWIQASLTNKLITALNEWSSPLSAPVPTNFSNLLSVSLHFVGVVKHMTESNWGRKGFILPYKSQVILHPWGMSRQELKVET